MNTSANIYRGIAQCNFQKYQAIFSGRLSRLKKTIKEQVLSKRIRKKIFNLGSVEEFKKGNHFFLRTKGLKRKLLVEYSFTRKTAESYRLILEKIDNKTSDNEICNSVKKLIEQLEEAKDSELICDSDQERNFLNSSIANAICLSEEFGYHGW